MKSQQKPWIIQTLLMSGAKRGNIAGVFIDPV